MNRRMFLSTAAAAPVVVPARVLGRDGAVAPGERVTMGVIGCGNQGTGQDKPWNTATHFYFDCIYRNGVTLTISDQPPGGVTFYGADGWVRANRGWIDANPKSLLESRIGPDETHLYESENHFENFIDCVLSRKQPIAPIETAHRSITISHLGNISLRLGHDLKWDPETERFPEDEEANKLLVRPMRHPWRIRLKQFNQDA